MSLTEGLDQADFARQMIRIVRRDAVQFREQLRRDQLWFRMMHAMHHTVSHRLDRGEDRLLSKPSQQKLHSSAVVGGSEAMDKRSRCRRIINQQDGPT